MSIRVEKAKTAILRALSELDGPAGAVRLGGRLGQMGVVLQPRTVRLYLLELDRLGLTRFISRRQGRVITDRGRQELARANVIEKVGFVAARVDSLAYRMTFNGRSGTGTIITNVAVLDERVASMALKEVERVFEAGLGMGQRMALAHAGEKLGGVEIPSGMVGLGTVCSVTLNGAMLHEGIPVTSRFGGLVEMRQGVPVRFVELIEYSGTTLDPLEVFIQADMTQVRQCVLTGSGIIGASLREIPAVAVDDVKRIEKVLKRHGLSGVLTLGNPGSPLLDIPIAEGRAGLIVVGGLNPVAALHEAGIRLNMMSLAGLEEFERFVDFREARGRYA